MRKDNDVTWLEGEKNIMAGAMEQFAYKTESFVLQAGDRLFMYTDGVTEAMNEQEDQFTSERLKKEIIDLQSKNIQDIVDGIMEKVVYFTRGVPQSDDITIMIVQFKG
jgi:sigma-B regulation protein RsbU (phosphoserine phosphatase)